jgi:uncharacterized protein
MGSESTVGNRRHGLRVEVPSVGSESKGGAGPLSQTSMQPSFGNPLVTYRLMPFLVATLLSAAILGAQSRIYDVVFVSRGTTLSGSIAIPVSRPIHAAVVFIHGSGRQTRNLGLARRFANAGIAALVYDKRGAGRSGGEYEGNQSVSERNISLLADDAVAALTRLARHPALRGVRVGFAGISQAGWIAPIAAQRSTDVRFLVLWSGPVVRVSEEDIFSKYTADRDGLTAPPYQEALRARTEPYVWPDFLGVDTDPSTALATLSIPGLWLFSDNDGSVPVDLSIERLQRLRKAGHPYDYLLFSGLGHNNMDQSFAAAVDWMTR